ncbi:MAG: response regulator [Thermodesulfobacteriota bacterium]
MMEILLAGGNLASMPAFKTALEENGALVTCLDSGQQTLDTVSEKTFDLLVADETLGDMAGLELIESVIMTQPMLNCAAVSSLSKEDYHEASEGLGVLMQLPSEPGKEDADALMKHLNKIQSIKVGS